MGTSEKKSSRLTKDQQDGLARLLDVLCRAESVDLLFTLACRFREYMDAGRAELESSLSGSGKTYQFALSFPLNQAATGHMRVYYWPKPVNEFTACLYATDSHDFAMHRHCSGPVWEALRAFFFELEGVSPQVA